MPNFNGAIIVHTLQMIKTPATLREIVVTIAKNIDLPQDDLMKPVKQTLDMGYRMGFLQKLNGRYFLVPMTFDTLMDEMKSMGQPARKSEMIEKVDAKPKLDKRTAKMNHVPNEYPSLSEYESTTTLIPSQSMHFKPEALLLRKPKRSLLPIK